MIIIDGDSPFTLASSPFLHQILQKKECDETINRFNIMNIVRDMGWEKLRCSDVCNRDNDVRTARTK